MRLILYNRFWFAHIPFVRRSNYSFLHNSQWTTFPTQSCLVLFAFGACLLYLLIMWLTISFLSPHNVYLLFCWVWSSRCCFVLLLEEILFPFRRHVYIFLYAILSVCRLKYPYGYFSSHFCFLCFSFVLIVFMLSLLLLTAVISLSLLFLM